MKKSREISNGEKFGRLLVIEKSSQKVYKGCVAYNCICECGNKYLAPASLLLSGKIKSCGCLALENLKKGYLKSIEVNKKPEGEASFNRLYKSYKDRAIRKGQEFTLTESEFKFITSQNCHYCGRKPIQFYKHNNHRIPNGYYLYNGIDRKDTSHGYTTENSLPCCEVCNRAKMDMPYDEFIKWIEDITIFRKNIESCSLGYVFSEG